MDKLGEISKISSGHAFREAINEVEDGDTHVIQLRNVSKNSNINWNKLLKTQLVKGRKEPNWLKEGDIIFVSRGVHNFATYLNEVPFKTVCAPHFFIIRVDHKDYLPAFVTWQINQSYAQTYFESTSVGSSMKAINSETLKNLDIIHMDLKEQKKIIELHQSYLQERQNYQRLMDLRESEINEVSTRLLSRAMKG